MSPNGCNPCLRSKQAARMGGANRVSFELLSVIAVYDPATVGFDEFTRNREREVSHQRDKVTMPLDGGFEDGEAVVRVVKCYSLNAADEGFWATLHAGIIPHVLKDQMRIFWYGINVAVR